jgi:hypothetical protein
MGAISVRLGKSGKKEWQAEQVYGGLFCPGPDPLSFGPGRPMIQNWGSG